MSFYQIDIRKKILIPIILISLTGVALTLLLMLYLTEKQSDSMSRRALGQTRYAVKDQFRQAQHHLMPETIILSVDSSIQDAVLSGDKEAIAKKIIPARTAFDIDGIAVVDRNGEELVRTGPEIPVPRALIESGFNLERVAFFTRRGNSIWLTVVAPIRPGNGVTAGFVLAGIKIDDEFLNEIKEKTGADVAFQYDSLFIGSTQSAAVNALKHSFREEDFERAADGAMVYDETCIVDRIEIVTSGGSRADAYALLSTLDSINAKENNMTITLVTGMAILLVLIIAAYLASQSISKPLRVMSKRARMIAEGNYKQHIDYPGIKEIDELAASFNIMSEDLESNRIKLEEKAYTDGLTCLYNHRYFQDSLSSEINRVYRYKHPLSLIIMDIDDFKKINDNYGHKKGDVVLKVLAEKMWESIRETDIACRMGGEEFAIILPETTSYEAFAVAERLRLAISSQPIDEISRVTISLGVATFPDDASDKDSIIVAADTAMYQAKRQGKNQTIIYNPDTSQSLAPEEDRWLIEEAYYIDTLHALAAAVDAKDQYTHSHSEHVATFAGLIGHELVLSPTQIEHLRIAGLLHDVGKIGIPDYILKKPGALTDEEFQEIRLHPVFSERILTRTRLEPVLQAILYHHERLDGSGYPYGLTEDEIPLNARILAVADSFEAMISDRPYRKALSIEAAILELKKDSGTKLDATIVDALTRIIERDESVRNIIASRNGETITKQA